MTEFLIGFEKEIKATDINLKNLTLNRIDSIARMIRATFFLSNNFRKENELILLFSNKVIKINGKECKHLHIDEKSIAGALKSFLEGKNQPGFSELNEKEINLKEYLVIEENKKENKEIIKKKEKFLLGNVKGISSLIKEKIKKNQGISLGKKSYITSDCITIINYLKD